MRCHRNWEINKNSNKNLNLTNYNSKIKINK